MSSAPAPAQGKCTGTLPFTGPWLLAPMEGVTDPCFRDVVIDLHEPEQLGGAYTEFVRVLERGLEPARIRAHLGQRRHATPVGVQLMGRDPVALAATVESVVEAGAPLVDLNFGCPSKGALRGCAGSALLRDPAQLEQLVGATVRAAADRLPVTAKIRAGWDDATRVEDLARAVEQGGAAMLTIHCRTRAESYCPEVDWSRIRRAVQAVRIPVCGNGGVQTHADLERMRHETGCARVMVGQAALDDPWVFSGRQVGPARAARFLSDYAQALLDAGSSPRGAAARLKQLLRGWRAGGLVRDGDDRLSWLREPDPQRTLARVRRAAGCE